MGHGPRMDHDLLRALVGIPMEEVGVRRIACYEISSSKCEALPPSRAHTAVTVHLMIDS